MLHNDWKWENATYIFVVSVYYMLKEKSPDLQENRKITLAHILLKTYLQKYS